MENLSCNSEFWPFDLPQNISPSHSNTPQNFSEEELFTNFACNNPKRRAGRKKFQETRHPVYRGIRRRNGGRWVCEVREPKKKSRIWLGTYPTAEMAARAHDVAAMALRGRSACLNFANSAWVLPIPDTGDTKDIQKAATEAAEMFRPIRSDDSPSDVGFSTEEVRPRNVTVPTENLSYVDEEAIFGMPEFLGNMAEGLLLSRLPYVGSGVSWDDVETGDDLLLWTHSI